MPEWPRRSCDEPTIPSRRQVLTSVGGSRPRSVQRPGDARPGRAGRAASSTRCTASRTSRCGRSTACTGTSSSSTATCCSGCARRWPPQPEAGQHRHRLLGGRLRAWSRDGRHDQQPVPLPRRADRGAVWRRCTRSSTRPRLYAANGLQFLPFNTLYQLAVDAERGVAGRRRSRPCC